MNRFFTLLLAASCLTAVGQVTYPYNPDGNADGDIAVGDLQDFLVTYGNPFSPSEIMVGDSSLTYWVEQLSQTVQEQQEMIELLKGGDSRSLLYPDGLIGLESVSHDFVSGPYIVPEGYNLYLHRTGASPSDILDGEVGVWNSIDGFNVNDFVHNPSHHLLIGEGSVVDGPSGGMLIGFLAKRKVEVLTHSFYENQTLVVPDSKIFVASFLRPNNAALLVNGVPLVDESAFLIKPLVFSEGDTIAIAGTIDAQQFVLGYLVDEDYFETPLQDLQQEIEPNLIVSSSGDFDESFLPAPVDNGCSRMAILREGLSYDNWYGEDGTVGATDDGIIFLDGLGQIWQVQGDNDLTLFSESPFGSFVGLNNDGRLDLNGGLNSIVKYVSDSVVILGVGFNPNSGGANVRGLHVIRPDGEDQHIEMDPISSGNVIYSESNYSYPWVVLLSETTKQYFVNIETLESQVTTFSPGGVLHEGNFYFVDHLVPNSNPEYGWLKSYNPSTEEVTMLLDLESIPNNNWYGTSGNGSQYNYGFDFVVSAHAGDLAIVKNSNNTESEQIIICDLAGQFEDEYSVITANGNLSGPEVRTFDASNLPGFCLGSFNNIVIDGQIYFSNSAKLTYLDPWSQTLYEGCIPEATGMPPSFFFNLNDIEYSWPFYWKAPYSEPYMKLLGVESIWFY